MQRLRFFSESPGRQTILLLPLYATLEMRGCLRVRSSYTTLTLAMSQEFHDGEIIWADTLAPEHQRRSHIALENDEWVLRDGRNRGITEQPPPAWRFSPRNQGLA